MTGKKRTERLVLLGIVAFLVGLIVGFLVGISAAFLGAPLVWASALAAFSGGLTGSIVAGVGADSGR